MKMKLSGKFPKFITEPFNHKTTFILFCDIGSRIQSIPLKWNNWQEKAVVSNPKDLRKNNLRRDLHTICTVVIAAQTVYEIINSNNNSISTLETALLLTILLSNNFYLQLASKYKSEIVLYVNGLFPQTSKKNKISDIPSFIEACNVFFTWGICLSAKSFPGFVVGLRLFDPCKGSLLGFWMLPECNPNTNWIKITKVPIFVVNFLMWEFGMRTGIFVICGLQTICMLRLRELLNS